VILVARAAGVIVAALGLAAWSAATASASAGDMGFMVDGPLPQPAPVSSAGGPFATLMADAPMRYQRIGVAWDQFGTASTGFRCVAPTQTNSAPSIFTADVAKAERLGDVPLVIIGPDIWGATTGYHWPAGVQNPPTTPNDFEYECGVQVLLKTLTSRGLARAGMPVETFNEPDNSSYYVDPSQAGRYFGDLVAVGASQVHAIAGGFKSAWDETYATTYVNIVKSSGYDSSAKSWSVHDYNDVVNGQTVQSCSPSNLAACDHQSVSKFLAWLQRQGEPTDDVWVTEAGDASVGGASLTHSRSEEAHAAYDWEYLRTYARHTFWYQWQTSSWDGWDSALLDSTGQPRPSYCVIAYNETPTQALSDARCLGSSLTPLEADWAYNSYSPSDVPTGPD
jgi:hypothetical protein